MASNCAKPRASHLVGGNSNAANANSALGKDNKINTNTNMTASASGGTATSNQNESPIKASNNQVASLTHSNHYDRPVSPNYQQISQDIADNIINQSDGVSEQDLMYKLARETLEETKLELILSIRNLITACNKKKVSLVNNPNFTKVIRIIDDEKQTSSNVKAQLALLLCSLAKGGEHTVKVLNDSFVDDKIFNLILSSKDDALIEACLRCMRAIMSWPKVSRAWLLYDKYPFQNVTPPLTQQSNNGDINFSGPQRIIEYARNSKSYIVQECVADIFAATCCRNKDQMLLFNSGAISCIVQSLESSSSRVVISALNWLSTLCLRNPTVSSGAIISRCPSGLGLLDRLIKIMSKDECNEFQFLAAKCFAQIYRAVAPEQLKDDPRVAMYVLPTLIRMVHRDKPSQLRAEAADCIAYLIESDTKLQSIASICDHLIESLADMLEYENNVSSDVKDNNSQMLNYRYSRDRNFDWRDTMSNQKLNEQPQVLDLRSFSSSRSSGPISDTNISECNQEMRRAAFLALAALASNLELIRKKIFDTCSVMHHLVKALTDSDPRILKSVLTCLLSLSRSVQQLRTNFSENSVYSALKILLATSTDDILILVLAILCNISLDFSPGKHHFLDSTTIITLCNFTKGSDPFLRLHGMWILMNMSYQLKDPGLKFQILRTLGVEHLMRLLDIEGDEMLLLKTLGFLRNLLSHRPHIDEIMSNHGELIMRSLIRVFEKSTSTRINEQALCVLTNIADGTEGKTLIMGNRTILNYLARILSDADAGDVRLAAICCITNLAHKDQEGFQSRQIELRQYGIQDRLKTLLNTDDQILSDRVRTAYNQFLHGIDDKYVN